MVHYIATELGISQDHIQAVIYNELPFSGMQDCRRSAVGRLPRQWSHFHQTLAYYADLLMQLWEKIKQIQCGKLTRGVLFHQDNAPAQVCYPEMWNPTWQRPTLFSWFGSLGLLPIPKNEKGVQCSSFCQRLCYECCGPLSEAPSTQKGSVCSMTNVLIVLM